MHYSHLWVPHCWCCTSTNQKALPRSSVWVEAPDRVPFSSDVSCLPPLCWQEGWALESSRPPSPSWSEQSSVCASAPPGRPLSTHLGHSRVSGGEGGKVSGEREGGREGEEEWESDGGRRNGGGRKGEPLNNFIHTHVCHSSSCTASSLAHPPLH